MVSLSLILATCGRRYEVCQFIESLLQSTDVSLTEVELIVVDQNDLDFGLREDVCKYSDRLNIKYIHSHVKGLSLSRNIGLKVAEGRYIGFPDDDCLYYPDTVASVLLQFENHKCDYLIGRIFDKKNNINLLKPWPSSSKYLSKWNFYFLSSSITMFFKNSDLDYFDENLGLGASFGSCEDPDYIYRKILSGDVGLYNINVNVWHPDLPDHRYNLARVTSYSRGFGYFCRKNISAPIVMIMCGSILKRLVTTIFARGENKFPALAGYFKGLYQGFNGVVH
ncbi:TPA: glycosyltransferase family 2 protein [Vibrio vulnificus]|nr:glycosyltransferase family 2 protein [Vibrio vulnificus]